MMTYLTSFMSTLEGDKAVDRFNMATIMMMFLLITIEVVVVKVAVFEIEHSDERQYGTHSALLFYDRED